MAVVGAGFIGAEVASTAGVAGHGSDHDRHQARTIRRPARHGDGRRRGRDSTRANGVELICAAVIEDFYSGEGNVTGLRLGLTDATCRRRRGGWHRSRAQHRVAGRLRPGARRRRPVRSDGPDQRCRESWPWGTALPGSTKAAGTHRRVEHWTGALERAALAVEALLDADAVPQPPSLPYFWSDQYGVKLQFAGHAAGRRPRGDRGWATPSAHSFLAVYYRGDDPVAVLGMNQPRLFTKWRRQLNAACRLLPKRRRPAPQPPLAASGVFTEPLQTFQTPTSVTE